MTNIVTNESKMLGTEIYQLSIMILILAISTVVITQIVYGSTDINFGNVSDGKIRHAYVQAEDLSWYTYQNLNGTTERVMDHNSFRDFIEAKYAQYQNFDRDREIYQNRQLMVQMKILGNQLEQLIAQLASNFIASIFQNVFGTAVEVENPNDLSDVHITFNASWINGTQAHLDQNVTRSQGDLLVLFLNALVDGKINPDQLKDLELGMKVPEKEIEEEEEPSDDSGDGGGGSSDPGDDGSGRDFDPFDPTPIEPIPNPPEQPEPGDGDVEGDDGAGGA